jgi:photosystem II cytochrome c550
MLKRFVGLTVVAVLFVFQLFAGTAYGMELDDATRTVLLNDRGDTVTLTRQQADNGARQFGKVCSSCHALGVTKTNPNFDLSAETLAFATPRRDTVEGLVAYMNAPTTYDGEISIAEIHPSKKSADIYASMRNLTDEDLNNIAGHILIQPKVLGGKWGGGKVYY